MKFLFTNENINLSLAKDFQNLAYQIIGNKALLINDARTITETEELFSVTDGYLRDFSIKKIEVQKESAINHVYSNWPVDDNYTGSFSTLIFNKTNNELVLASDLCNIYPLYYLLKDGKYYISNSIILLGRYSGAAEDKTGILQRAIGPNFSNLGSRTILKDCKRLLPGEWLKFNTNGELIQRKYDNSLFQNISPREFTTDNIENYWQHYKKETALCCSDFSHVNIALSGGIDSRIALGSIAEKDISAYTYGSPKNYESQVAGKLAKSKGAKHRIYFDTNQYFPKKNTLENYTRETEAIKLNSWLEILTKVEPNQKEPLLLGELCEALPGRNIQKLNTGEFRKKNFYKYYVKNENIELTPGSLSAFNQWKHKKMGVILSWHVDFWFDKLNFSAIRGDIINETKDDAEEIFKRIESHQLPYVELYDELFSWFTYTRMVLSRQVNICNEKFYAFSPGMSIQMLKKTSNIHPNHRLYYRFANKLLRIVPELKGFGKIPTSQIPLVAQNSSNLLKVPIWALRSKIDDWLIKRMMSNKNINLRYRLFRSINWAKVYQQKDMLENIEDYYENNHLSKEYFEIFFNLAQNRKDLLKWPFANMDIISGATLNTELDLIKNYPE